MTISKERLNEIALEVACTLDLENPLCNVGITWINGFSLALIRRVEAETGGEANKFSCRADGTYDTFVQLPLVSEE